MFNRRSILLGGFSIGVPWPRWLRAVRTQAEAAETAGGEPYFVEEAEGWRVHVASSLRRLDPGLCDEALQQVRYQLYFIRRKVPPRAANILRQTVIVIDDAPGGTGVVYRAGGGDRAAAWAGPTIEIGDPRAFLSETRAQPCMLLTALAEAYYHQRVDGSALAAEVEAAHAAAARSGKYNRVLCADGSRRRHPAIGSPVAYFAAASTAYFGTSDCYPFVRGQLREADRSGCELVARTWIQRQESRS
jgi:hypothetical protein